MTNFGSVHPHLASLTNSRFLAAFGEGITLASVVSPLHALLRRVLPTLGSVNERMLAPIHGEKQVTWPCCLQQAGALGALQATACLRADTHRQATSLGGP